MSDVISAIEQTRRTAAEILARSLKDSQGKTEADVRNSIHKEIALRPELFLDGWYDPPPGGIAVLASDPPYDRLKFNSLRDQEFFPSGEHVIGPESVTMAYFSPVERTQGLFGDIGLTVYSGIDNAVRDHIRTCLTLLVGAANSIEVGMNFSDVYTSSLKRFKQQGKVIGWMTTINDPTKGANLGHTVPGSYGDESIPVDSFTETKKAITKRRVYFNGIESFMVPETGAFTFEVRLTDTQMSLPNTFFHVIVAFENGNRRVLTNFDDIFRATGMDYMI